MIGFSLDSRLPPSPHHRSSLRSSLVPVIMSHEESTSLEEINKQRIALGLKPLTDDKASVDSPEKQAEDNYAKQREKEAQERETKYVHSSYSPAPLLTYGVLALFRRIQEQIAK